MAVYFNVVQCEVTGLIIWPSGAEASRRSSESISSEMCFSGLWCVNNEGFRAGLAALTSHLQRTRVEQQPFPSESLLMN